MQQHQNWIWHQDQFRGRNASATTSNLDFIIIFFRTFCFKINWRIRESEWMRERERERERRWLSIRGKECGVGTGFLIDRWSSVNFGLQTFCQCFSSWHVFQVFAFCSNSQISRCTQKQISSLAKEIPLIKNFCFKLFAKCHLNFASLINRKARCITFSN